MIKSIFKINNAIEKEQIAIIYTQYKHHHWSSQIIQSPKINETAFEIETQIGLENLSGKNMPE